MKTTLLAALLSMLWALSTGAASLPALTNPPLDPAAAAKPAPVGSLDEVGLAASPVPAPPVLDCPSNLVVWACSTRAVVRYNLGATAACGTSVTVSCDPPDGSVLSLGTHAVRCKALDDCGNSTTCSFNATVRPDIGAPILDCPTNVTALCTSSNGALISYSATASDDHDPAPVVTCRPASGTYFRVGETRVRCTASDRCGNMSECSFHVTVLDDVRPRLSIERLAAGAPEVLFCWPQTCRQYQLQCTTDPKPPIVWVPVTEPVLMLSNKLCVRLPEKRLPGRFYRLQSVAARIEDAIQRQARALIALNAPALGLEEDTYEVHGRGLEDDLGQLHARFERFHQGLPVIGGDFVVHLLTVQGAAQFLGFSATVTQALHLNLAPQVEVSDALRFALEEFQGELSRPPAARLIVYAADESGAAPELAYDILLDGKQNGFPTHLHRVVSASNGKIITSYDDVWTGRPPRRECAVASGHGFFNEMVRLDTTAVFAENALSPTAYELHDCRRQIDTYYTDNDTRVPIPGYSVTLPTIPGQLALDPDNNWGSGTFGTDPAHVTDFQTAAVDAHYGLAQAYDYFLREHHRCGIDGVCDYSMDGAPLPIIASVQYGRPDCFENANAFFDTVSGQLGFGSGGMGCVPDDPCDFDTGFHRLPFRPFVSPDVVGHEYTHALTYYTANLLHRDQSGALNESMSDVFGKMVEFAIRGRETGWWLGVEVYTPDTDGDAFRYMDTPRRDGYSIDSWKQYPACSLDPHHNCGLPNNVFYLLAHGGTHPSTLQTVTGIGSQPAARIWYRALTVYMTSATTFRLAAFDTLRAAVDLYGDGPEARSVFDAWRAVGVLP